MGQGFVPQGAFVDHSRITLQIDIRKIRSVPAIINAQGNSAMLPEGHGGSSLSENTRYQSDGHRAGAAGQGFVFHATFVGPHMSHAGIAEHGEIHIGSGWPEPFVMSDGPTQTHHVRFRDVLHKQDDMGDAGIEEMARNRCVPYRDLDIRLKGMGYGHLDFYIRTRYLSASFKETVQNLALAGQEISKKELL